MPEFTFTAQAYTYLDEEEEEVYVLEGESQETPELHGVIEMVTATVATDEGTVTIELLDPQGTNVLVVEDVTDNQFVIFPRRLTTDYAGNLDDTAGDVGYRPHFVIGRLGLTITPSVFEEAVTDAWIGTINIRIWVRKV